MTAPCAATLRDEAEPVAPPLDAERIREAYRQLDHCIERIAELDRSKESRPVRQMLAFLWAAHDTLDDFARPRSRRP